MEIASKYATAVYWKVGVSGRGTMLVANACSLTSTSLHMFMAWCLSTRASSLLTFCHEFDELVRKILSCQRGISNRAFGKREVHFAILEREDVSAGINVALHILNSDPEVLRDGSLHAFPARWKSVNPVSC
jgi:hypothetical protein